MGKTLKEVLKDYTREGELYERQERDRVLCYACGHRCVILPGLDGICRVRYNEGGTLMVPAGYVGAIQCDPTEKKPFFHAYPGSLALTFGMLGCDLHCSYCFTGETTTVTDLGPMSLSEIFEKAETFRKMPDAEVGFMSGLKVVSGSGNLRQVRAAFKHPYRGEMISIAPYYLPGLECTPDHRIYATSDTSRAPEPTQARFLTDKHYLAVPRRFEFSGAMEINTFDLLGSQLITYRAPWELSLEDRQFITEATARGETSRQIGALIGKGPSYVRHVRSKIARDGVSERRTSGPIIEGLSLRYPNEHRPGIPLVLPLTTGMGRLLGLYCAEGSITASKNRPNSSVLNFAFSTKEQELAEETSELLKRHLGVKSFLVRRETTLAVAANKSSAARLFKSLCGGRASEKRVPGVVFEASEAVARSFLEAYVEGDGHRYANGKVSVTTVSRKLAYGVAWLALKLGYIPSVYETATEEEGVIQGRKVKRSPFQFTVAWYENSSITRRLIETEDYYLVPIKSVGSREFDGDVYNLEVEEEHNYLANFALVSNCQNWVTSQALRDPKAVAPPRVVTPEQMAETARRYGARLVVSSYNEPLITSEWAVEIFKQAKPSGFACGYVSNGNATPEVLDYIRPFVDLYKIDLKGFDDRNYRKLGGVLENVLNSIKMVHERGFWLEIVTLIIPGFNDSTDELKAAADFIAGVSPDIPWHVTAFHQDYKMTGPSNTSVETLIRAAEIGYGAGLRFVYAGNLPGRVGRYENTFCPGCKATLIERYGFHVLKNRLEAGRCPDCRHSIPGLWD
ncbi:MAG TPA: radical SAM protein [Blastocatellia bacterium]|nr:radical SAM protein [Blastocatellia bacterium]